MQTYQITSVLTDIDGVHVAVTYQDSTTGVTVQRRHTFAFNPDPVKLVAMLNADAKARLAESNAGLAAPAPAAGPPVAVV